MSRKQAICLVLVLLIGWGSAFACAYFTDRKGLAVAVFIATLMVFAYWPLGRDDE